MNPQAASSISLAEWVPVLQRWFGLRHALLVGQRELALRQLQASATAVTLFKASASDLGLPNSLAKSGAIGSGVSKRPNPNITWPWLIAEQTGTCQFHLNSLNRENGLMPAKALTGCWPGIKNLGSYTVQAFSMDFAFAQACAKAATKTDSIQHANWLWLTCLPGLALLRGASLLLNQIDVLALRVQMHLGAEHDAGLPESQAWLQDQGFALCGVEFERNPQLGTALFVRNYHAAYSTTRIERDELKRAQSELQAQLTDEIHAMHAETTAKAEAINQGDELAWVQSELHVQLASETAAKHAEATAKAEAQKQSDELIKSHALPQDQLWVETQAKETEIGNRIAAQQHDESLTKNSELSFAQIQALLNEQTDLQTIQAQNEVQLQALVQEDAAVLKKQEFFDNHFLVLEAQIDLIKQLMLGERMASEVSLSDEDLDPALDSSAPASIDLQLLQRVVTQWQFGDWQSLVQLDIATLQNHPDRAQLALYAAAGQQQIGEMGLTLRFIRKAQVWGCEPILVKQLMISGVHNTLGLAEAKLGNFERSNEHFKAAIDLGTPGADRLVYKARTAYQVRSIERRPNATSE